MSTSYAFITVYIEWAERKYSLVNYILFAYFGFILLMILCYMIVGNRMMNARMHRIFLRMDLYNEEKRKRVEYLIDDAEVESRAYSETMNSRTGMDSARSLTMMTEHSEMYDTESLYENGMKMYSTSTTRANMYAQKKTFVRHVALNENKSIFH